MRYAIVSDIHGNYEAFTAVLDVIDGMDVDGIVCLGDVV
ncbi:metallophosphoesterase family protein, partial [bacterium]|nr:metallophosphoesterase family protein [bacterium]